MTCRHCGEVHPFHELCRVMAAAHVVTLRRSPATVTLLCSCGWRHTETRHQNALARAAKLRAAEARHLDGNSL